MSKSCVLLLAMALLPALVAGSEGHVSGWAGSVIVPSGSLTCDKGEAPLTLAGWTMVFVMMVYVKVQDVGRILA